MFGLHRVRFAVLAACCVPIAGCGGGSAYVPSAGQDRAAQTGSAAFAVPVTPVGTEAFAVPADAFAAALTDASATAPSAADDPLDTLLDPSGAIALDAASDAALAGTYDGTLVEKAAGITIKGTVVITLALDASDVSGKFVFTYKGRKSTVTYTGTGHHTAHGFAMSLLLVDKKGCTARGPATVVNKKLSGSYAAPKCKSETPSTGTYKAVKS